jgi:hypothetical protein
LDNKWRGPFKVLGSRGLAAYELELPASWQGHRVFNSSRLKKFHEAVFPGQPRIGSRPNPVITNEEREEYKVHEILDKQITRKGTKCLIRWKDYGPEDDTWEVTGNLKNARDAVHDFESQGQASGEVGHHVMATVTEAEEQHKPGLVQLPIGSQEGMNQVPSSSLKEWDSSTSNQDNGSRSILMGKLCK